MWSRDLGFEDLNSDVWDVGGFEDGLAYKVGFAPPEHDHGYVLLDDDPFRPVPRHSWRGMVSMRTMGMMMMRRRMASVRVAKVVAERKGCDEKYEEQGRAEASTFALTQVSSIHPYNHCWKNRRVFCCCDVK